MEALHPALTVPPDLPGHMVIGDDRITAGSLGSTDVFDPGTGRVLTVLPAGGKPEVDRAVEAAKAVQAEWAAFDPARRARILHRAGEIIRREAERLAVVETLDVGKPLKSAAVSVQRAADYYTYYAGAVDKVGGETVPRGPGKVTFTERVPIGVTGHIIPWNVPISTVARGLAPALACGNTAVIKPAEVAALSTIMTVELLLEAGVPLGVVNVVTGPGSKAGQALTEHPDVGHLTFTGSVPTGIRVMEAAAKHVASVTLELGGKSPHVVLDDADLDIVAGDVVRNAFANAGQICSAGSRLLVERGIHRLLLERIVERTAAMRLGHGLGDPDMGPLVSPQQLATVGGFVERARDRGVEIPAGGEPRVVDGFEDGFFYAPTIADDVPADDELALDEIFGPVLTVIVVDGVDHAVEVANATEFGLAAGIHTRDIDKALRLARGIEAGQVYINGYHSAGDTVPFGGMRKSGIGREKGLKALDSYSEIKAVTITLR